MSKQQTTETTQTNPFAGLPKKQFAATTGKWAAPAGLYLDHTHPRVLLAVAEFYAATGAPVSKWAKAAGFQSSAPLKAHLNRELRAASLATFSKGGAAAVAS